MKGLFISLIIISFAAKFAVAIESVALKDVSIAETNEARQRGAETVVDVCLMCHSLKYIKFDNLTEIGMSKESIQGLTAGESTNNRMLSLSSDAERKEYYGMLPPDLSLMAIARKDGPQYIYSLLIGYYTNDSGDEDNHVFPGIKMPDMMGYGYTEEGSEARAAIEAQARDVASFLLWAADPNAAERQSLGRYVIAYLVVFTLLLYLVKRRVWHGLH